MIKVAINGFGRIGRAAFKIAQDNPKLEVVAINDLGEIDNLAYLLQYDSVYRRYNKKVEVKDGVLQVDGKVIKVLNEKDPAKLPWTNEGVDVVIESTGIFTTYDEARGHLDAGAKRVVISAPTKSDDQVPTILMGVNHQDLDPGKNPIVANASCTTNAVSPVAEIMCRRFKVQKAILSTIHGYTATQNLVDGPHPKDYRRGRAAAVNMVLTTTGAAEATAKVLPQLADKFTGVAIRVPTAIVSLADMVYVLDEKVTAEQINKAIKEEADSERYREILGYCQAPLVSSDIIQSSESSIVDPDFTKVVDGDLVKVMAWYDNEWAYSVRLVELVELISNDL